MLHKFIVDNELYGKVGAFEGAGYASEGLYRPMLDCMMFTRKCDTFCKVSTYGIIRVLKHYTD